MDVKGNAIVVGGGSGIGKACAIGLAKEGVSKLMIADLSIDAGKNTLAECQTVATHPQFEGRVTSTDVTQEDSVISLFQQTVDAFGRIDYCVNSAGIGAQKSMDIAELSLAEFQRFLNVNNTGMFLVTRQASIVMRAQHEIPVSASNPKRGATRGAIVNIASANSLVAVPGLLPYTTSKHAALGLTKNSALDNAPHAIRVNCVCPSWVATPMVTQAMAGVEGLVDYINSAVPFGRIADPEEVADAVVFLCSARSSYVTGSALIIDGGTTLTALR